jgi:signal transduction histidine kinase
MKGAPLQGHERTAIVGLNESRDLQSFQAELVRLVGAMVRHAEVLFAPVDRETESLVLPSWIQSYFERHPGLLSKLELGEILGISYTGENPVLRPARAVRSSVVLIPMIWDEALCGVVGLMTPLDGPQPSAEDVDSVRRLADDGAPILGRHQEMEMLRRVNTRLKTRAQRPALPDNAAAQPLEERDALRAALQLRSHLQANIAHDLRTPLAAVRGYTRMILDGRAGAVTETQNKYLRVVEDNANRLIDCVSWMSFVSELVQHLSLCVFDLRAAWTECAAACRDALKEKDLILQEKIADVDFAIVGDRAKLIAVLKGLVAAAARFSEPGGVITAEFSRGREKEVTVKISERSPIPPDVLSRIFERPANPFGQIAEQVADAGPITMAGAADVVGMHGGRFYVNNTAPQGAAFLFTLPAVTLGGEENSHEQAVNSGSRRR